MKKVLVPTDFSKCAEVALVQGMVFAKRHGAELHVVHVLPSYESLPYVPMLSGDWSKFFADQEEQAQEQFDKLLEPYDMEPVIVARHVRLGSAVTPEILRVEREINADLIVMGAHGERGFRRWFFGSVTQEVVRLANCPVMSVRETARPTFELGPARMVVPVDLSETSRQALWLAKELAGPHTTLELVHVLELSTSHLETEPTRRGLTGASQASPEQITRIERAIAQFADRSGGPDVAAQIRILEGAPAETIAGFAEEIDADLVIIATRAQSALTEFLLGSVTERLLRLASCPVLTLKIDEAEAAS